MEILQNGLLIYSDSVTHNGEHRWPYVCFGPTPSVAWALSGDFIQESEFEEWDLWMYRIREEDSVHVRPNFGPSVEEIKIHNSIPPGCLWYVATRSGLVAIEPPPKPKRKRKSKARKKK